MSAYEKALKEAGNLAVGKWRLGIALRYAMDSEGKEIREFCRERDGNTDHEDSYSNYVKASRFRLLIRSLPEYTVLMQLPISYFWVAYRGYDNGIDFELLIEWLLEMFKQDGSKKSVRALQGKISEAVGDVKTFDDYIRDLRRWWERARPVIIGRKSALNASEAAKAQAIEFHMNEIERLIDGTMESD